MFVKPSSCGTLDLFRGIRESFRPLLEVPRKKGFQLSITINATNQGSREIILEALRPVYNTFQEAGAKVEIYCCLRAKEEYPKELNQYFECSRGEWKEIVKAHRRMVGFLSARATRALSELTRQLASMGRQVPRHLRCSRCQQSSCGPSIVANTRHQCRYRLHGPML